MPIEIACHCGKRFRIADRFAGKSGKCPACGAAFSVPVPKALANGAGGASDAGDGAIALSELDAPADVELRRAPAPEAPKKRGRTCAGCNAPMAERAIVCTACGRSSVTGKMLETQAGGDDRESSRGFFLFRPLLEIGSLRLSPALILVLLALIAAPVAWWMNGPGRKLAVYDAQRVWVLPAMNTGKAEDQYSLLRGTGNMALGMKGSGTGMTNVQADDGLYHTIGGADELIVLRPGGGAADAEGQGVLLEVGLQQGALRQAGSTSGYDTVVDVDDFELVPLEGQHGGEPIPARLLSATYFRSESTLDIGIAPTTNVKKALPAAEPTRFNEQKETGRVDAIAVFDGHTRGTVRLSAARSVDGYPAPDGVTATGELTTTHPGDPSFGVEHRYTGGQLVVDWDDTDQGRWATDSVRQVSDMSPYYRYKFGLLFQAEGNEAPSGRYTVRFADRELATVKLGPAPASSSTTTTASANDPNAQSLAARGKPSPVSPIRRAAGAPPTRTINPNNPMSYFDILLESRDRARGIVSASNLRQIGLAMLTYLQDTGDWPESFADLEKHTPGFTALLTNPRTGESPGFLYERPEPGADPSTTPVVWETYGGAKDPQGAVLYADGSIR